MGGARAPESLVSCRRAGELALQRFLTMQFLHARQHPRQFRGCRRSRIFFNQRLGDIFRLRVMLPLEQILEQRLLFLAVMRRGIVAQRGQIEL
jgi:hypothetical protein